MIFSRRTEEDVMLGTILLVALNMQMILCWPPNLEDVLKINQIIEQLSLIITNLEPRNSKTKGIAFLTVKQQLYNIESIF